MIRGAGMIVFVDDRESVSDGYYSWFGREGVALASFSPTEFDDWVTAVDKIDIDAIEAFLIGRCESRPRLTQAIKKRTEAAVIAVNDGKSLEDTLKLFDAGVDDVVEKPVHVRELLARIAAIARRSRPETPETPGGDIKIFFDGRDPEVGGEAMALPRRERKILEYLVSKRGRRVTKSQIFNSVYGLFDQRIDDNVVESHISKLRKRLRGRLGYDPIDSKRHLGYCLLTR